MPKQRANLANFHQKGLWDQVSQNESMRRTGRLRVEWGPGEVVRYLIPLERERGASQKESSQIKAEKKLHIGTKNKRLSARQGQARR